MGHWNNAQQISVAPAQGWHPRRVDPLTGCVETANPTLTCSLDLPLPNTLTSPSHSQTHFHAPTLTEKPHRGAHCDSKWYVLIYKNCFDDSGCHTYTAARAPPGPPSTCRVADAPPDETDEPEAFDATHSRWHVRVTDGAVKAPM